MFFTCVRPKHLKVMMFFTCQLKMLKVIMFLNLWADHPGGRLPPPEEQDMVALNQIDSIWNKQNVTFGFWGIWQERPSANSCIQVHPLILQLIWVYRLTLKKDSKMWCSQITKRWITQSLTKNVQYTWNVNTVVFLMDCIGTFCCQVKYHQCLLQTDTRTWFEVTHGPHSILRENTK